jgi:hypothetical protein
VGCGPIPGLVTTATGTDHLAGAQGPVVSGFSDDMVIMGTQCGTQWDALSHIFYRGQMWNGYSAAEHTSIGAARNGIQQWRDRLVLRAVLVDLPRHRGVTSLDPGYAITVDDLEETLAAQGSSVHAGDALLVRCQPVLPRACDRADAATTADHDRRDDASCARFGADPGLRSRPPQPTPQPW